MYVKEKQIWSKSSTKSSLEGIRIEYRCIGGKYRTAECPAALYLLYHSTDMKVTLFETVCKHNDHDVDPQRGLSVAMKNFVKEKFEEGIQKPNAVLAAIRRKEVREPPKSKLIAYLKRLRYEKYGSPRVSAGEIHSWCSERTQIPTNEDEPFVLDHLIRAESLDIDEQDLKIVISTKRLLQNLKKSAMVQIDATYKLIWQGYPVMILGTSDKNQVFHPFGLAICKDEAAEDFAFIFRAFHNFDPHWNPSVLLADGSEAITGGFRSIFGEPAVRIMCFFHVLKNLEPYFKGLKKRDECVKLKLDIQSLQTCSNETSFLKATELFFLKWRAKNDRQVNEFLEYFKNQWVLKRSCWYEGAAPGYPSTNNGIEGTNAVIKTEHTLRERLPVGQFLNNVIQLVSKWSKVRDPTSPNCIDFAESRSTPLAQWTAGYQWALKNKKVLQGPTDNPDSITFFVSSSTSRKEIIPKTVTEYEESTKHWKDFDEFQRINYGTWKIGINKKTSQSECSCPYFMKHLICKHSLGMQIRLKFVDPPAAAKSIPMGQKRKRGRPSKAKKALLVQ